jgi:hypothetical protein
MARVSWPSPASLYPALCRSMCISFDKTHYLNLQLLVHRLQIGQLRPRVISCVRIVN